MIKYETVSINSTPFPGVKANKNVRTAIINTMAFIGLKHVQPKDPRPVVVNYTKGLFMKNFASHKVYLESEVQRKEYLSTSRRPKLMENDSRSIVLRFKTLRT